MMVSLFDLFKIGIGPSSSHTVGPMKAAYQFAHELNTSNKISETSRVIVELFGSLSHTGIGHGTDKAVILGLIGYLPDSVPIDQITTVPESARKDKSISILKTKMIEFDPAKNIVFHKRKILSEHSNGMTFSAYNNSDLIHSKTYFSIGGGFVVPAGQVKNQQKNVSSFPYPFATGDELLRITKEKNCTIAELVWQNERSLHSETEILTKIRKIWAIMDGCIDLGCKTPGILPGKLKVERRAPELYKRLIASADNDSLDPLSILDWVNVFALAVCEENAAGSRVVTAPTNGAAGIIPALIRYYLTFCKGASEKGMIDFLLTATAIGNLYLQNASISGAEVGCQGEVGVACSMAAAGLCAVLGGSALQIEQAAEIGMEHNLGLTCDPIGGLVQIPCVERNAMGAVKAINAARMAMAGTGVHFVSLDSVIKTMRATGADMKDKYKETSRGGLAVNIPEC